MKSKYLMSLVLLFSLCSCNTPSNTSNNDATIENPWWTSTGEITKDEDGNIVFDDVSIKLTSVICGNDQTRFEQLIDQFNKEHRGEITITHTAYNQDTIDETCAKQIAQNSDAPDLILDHQKSHKNFAYQKLIQPIDECFNYAEISYDKNNYLPNLASYCDLGYEGRMFTLPVDAQSEVIYYNKALINKYNNGNLPSNRSEFMELCKKVQDEERKTKPSFNAITTGTDYDFFKMYLIPTALVQNGAKFYNEADLKSYWTETENLAAFKRGINSMKEWIDDGLWTYGQSSTAAMSIFCNDNALFFISLPFDANVLFSTYSASHGGKSVDIVKSEDIGGFSTSGLFAMEGSNEADSRKIFGDSHAFMVSKTVTDVSKKAAIAVFCEWFTKTGTVGAEWAEVGHTSGSYTILSSQEYRNNTFVTDYIVNFYEDMNSFQTAGNTKYYSVTFPKLQEALINCLENATGDAEIENILRKYQTEVNNTIDILEMEA